MPNPARALSLLLALLLAGCDSSSLYTADLGQTASLPAVKALSAPPPAGVQGEVLEFVAPSGGTLPSQWLAAQSLKLDVAGTFLPMVQATVGATPSFDATVPSTLGFVPPPRGSSASMAFELDGERVMVAEVTF